MYICIYFTSFLHLNCLLLPFYPVLLLFGFCLVVSALSLPVDAIYVIMWIVLLPMDDATTYTT